VKNICQWVGWRESRAQWKTTGLVAERTDEGENRQSDYGIGKAQVEDSAELDGQCSEEPIVQTHKI